MSGPTPGNGRKANWRILLDSPTAKPALGYDDIAQTLAKIIKHSEPRFAVGIFGGWGSGKTTLMNCIRASLSSNDLVTVDFNAWRFEREPQLLLPLLDTVRAGLMDWAAGQEKRKGKTVRASAARIGRVVRALATGLSAQVGMPGAVTVSYDANTALNALSGAQEAANPQSLYFAAFQELQKAFDEFKAGGIDRVVIFVDDLDRCLPQNALQVLESMKLFFDLRGFVFVVGLDQDVVERAIRAKFADGSDVSAPRDGSSPVLGSRKLGPEYLKKIFQVPYTLPAMVPLQLDDLLSSMYREEELDQEQLDDLRSRVPNYLKHVVGRQVNPREVKRFINGYILQTCIRSDLDPETILAVQTLAFRYEWAQLYNAILADTSAFVVALRQYREGTDSALTGLLPELEPLAASLEVFLSSSEAEPLIRYESLDDYLSSLNSTRISRPWLEEILPVVSALRVEIRDALGRNATADEVVQIAEKGRLRIQALTIETGHSRVPEHLFNFWMALGGLTGYRINKTMPDTELRREVEKLQMLADIALAQLEYINARQDLLIS
jgi:hypothetical protein